MSRRPFVVIVSCALAAGTITTWYVRPMRDARLIGLRGLTPGSGRTCRSTLSEVFCSNVVPLGPVPEVQEMLTFDSRTRRVLSALHVWHFPDSSRWQATLDSVRRALDARYGFPVTCDDQPRSSPHPAVSQGWRFGAREVRLVAAHADSRRGSRPSWFVSLLLGSRYPPKCAADVQRRLLTPAEMRIAFRDWLGEYFRR